QHELLDQVRQALRAESAGRVLSRTRPATLRAHMKPTIVILLTLMIVLPPVANGRSTTKVPDAKHGRLENASPSADDLIRRFVDALDKQDAAALRHLRTTESEYRNIILPGTISPGTPARKYREDVSRYFWGALNGKSAGYEKYLLDTAGG